MSYSFNARGADKAAVLTAVNAQFDTIVAAQPVHAQDRAAAIETVDRFVSLVPPVDGCVYSVAVNGSCWANVDALRSASVGVSVSLIADDA